jgi:hypothetical protein
MKLKIKILISAAVFSLLTIVPSIVTAAPGGIQISPLTFKYEIKPGASETGVVTIKNLNNENLDYTIEAENFTVVSDDGAPSFSGSTDSNSPSSLANWITVSKDKDGTILPQGEKDVSFTINAPSNAEPGGHYAAIFARQVKKTDEGQTQLGISSRVGTLILVTVPGAVKKGAEITEFTHPQIVWKGPVDFGMKVKNTGNIHFDSKVTLAIKPLVGNTDSVDLGTHTILPNNSRIFSGSWLKQYPFGRYEIQATATDTDGNPITQTAVLWAIPIMIVIPGLVVLLLLILVVRYLRRHLKFVDNSANDKK